MKLHLYFTVALHKALQLPDGEDFIIEHPCLPRVGEAIDLTDIYMDLDKDGQSYLKMAFESKGFPVVYQVMHKIGVKLKPIIEVYIKLEKDEIDY